MQDLSFLSHAKPSIRAYILKSCDKNTIKALCEICFNLIKGNIECDSKTLKKLRVYKKTIYKVGSNKN